MPLPGLRMVRAMSQRATSPDTGDQTRGSDGMPRNYLRACLLLILAEGPAHGYEMVDQLGDLGVGSVDKGGMYRTLRTMEEDGLVASGWEPSQNGPGAGATGSPLRVGRGSTRGRKPCGPAGRSPPPTCAGTSWLAPRCPLPVPPARRRQPDGSRRRSRSHPFGGAGGVPVRRRGVGVTARSAPRPPAVAAFHP